MAIHQIVLARVFDWDQDIAIGEQLKRFMGEVMELAEQTGTFKIHLPAHARPATSSWQRLMGVRVTRTNIATTVCDRL